MGIISKSQVLTIPGGNNERCRWSFVVLQKPIE
jgi:hypothetical protein